MNYNPFQRLYLCPVYFQFHGTGGNGHPGHRQSRLCAAEMGLPIPGYTVVGLCTLQSPGLLGALTQDIITMQWGLSQHENSANSIPLRRLWNPHTHGCWTQLSACGVTKQPWSRQAPSQHCVCPKKGGRGPAEKDKPPSLKTVWRAWLNGTTWHNEGGTVSRILPSKGHCDHSLSVPHFALEPHHIWVLDSSWGGWEDQWDTAHKIQCGQLLREHMMTKCILKTHAEQDNWWISKPCSYLPEGFEGTQVSQPNSTCPSLNSKRTLDADKSSMF